MDTGKFYIVDLKVLLLGSYHINQVHRRYCEFNSRPDPTRGASWNKIASILLIVHCSQYVMALDSGRQQGALAAQAGLLSTRSMRTGQLLTPTVNCCCAFACRCCDSELRHKHRTAVSRLWTQQRHFVQQRLWWQFHHQCRYSMTPDCGSTIGGLHLLLLQSHDNVSAFCHQHIAFGPVHCRASRANNYAADLHYVR